MNIESLDRDYDTLWGSMIKQTLLRVHPGFNETYYGYRGFPVDSMNSVSAPTKRSGTSQ